MMQWNRQDIDDFKAKLSITDVASQLGITINKGKASCFNAAGHKNGDRHPSLSFQEDLGFYKCWVCSDVSGDTISLVQKVLDLPFYRALDWLADKYSYWVPESVLLGNPISVQNIPNKSKELKPQKPKVVVPPKAVVLPLAEDLRHTIFLRFLQNCEPLQGAEMRYLNKRKIFKDLIDKQKLRKLADYGLVQEAMRKEFSLEDLQKAGLFNENGFLRFYKHSLIFPYINEEGRVVFFQGRSIDSSVFPKELNPRGRISLPYNVLALQEEQKSIYLAEGVIDTLTLLQKGFLAVGIPGAQNFRREWAKLFLNKSVYLMFDKDDAGQNGALKVKEFLEAEGISASLPEEWLPENLQMPDGFDINDWFCKR